MTFSYHKEFDDGVIDLHFELDSFDSFIIDIFEQLIISFCGVSEAKVIRRRLADDVIFQCSRVVSVTCCQADVVSCISIIHPISLGEIL